MPGGASGVSEGCVDGTTSSGLLPGTRGSGGCAAAHLVVDGPSITELAEHPNEPHHLIAPIDGPPRVPRARSPAMAASVVHGGPRTPPPVLRRAGVGARWQKNRFGPCLSTRSRLQLVLEHPRPVVAAPWTHDIGGLPFSRPSSLNGRRSGSLSSPLRERCALRDRTPRRRERASRE